MRSDRYGIYVTTVNTKNWIQRLEAGIFDSERIK
uniref:Uncharacterized protein n=1 Tax=Rhizophora mucronata TaxID=61149 RepID=A0A2P2PLV4_RHIMU